MDTVPQPNLPMNRREFVLSLLGFLIVRGRIDDAVSLIESATTAGWFETEASVSAASLQVKQGNFALARSFGKAKQTNAVYLLTSLSKPMIATGIVILSDRGFLSLNEPVRKYLPEFTGDGRDDVSIKQLLTHTAGLPELLPEESQLFSNHAPLEDFVQETCRTPLRFRPGTRVSYSNLGVLLAAEIAQRIVHTAYRDFLRKELFEPLEMMDTYLGLGRYKIEDIVPAQQGNLKLHPNDRYYWDLGAPWGGVHSTISDVTKFLNVFLGSGGRLLKKSSAESMITNQTAGLNQPWGMGWMLAQSHDFDVELWRSYYRFPWLWPKYQASLRGCFGQRCSPRSFGHYGVSGTLAWADPNTQGTFVLLTTKQVHYSRDGILGPVSDLVAEAFADEPA